MKNKTITLTTLLVPALTVFLLILLLLSNRIFIMQSDGIESANEELLLICVLQIMIFVFPCITYYFLRGRTLNTPFMISSMHNGGLLFVIEASLLLISGNLLIKCFYYIGSGKLPSGIDHIVPDTASVNDASAAAVILAVALLPAICEELFFRGIVLAEYRVFGSFNAVVFSSICFAMIHFSVEAFPLYFFSGLVLGVAATVTKSIFIPIIIHFISNMLSIYASDSFIRVTVQKSGGFFTAFIVGVIMLLSLVLVLSNTEKIFYRRAGKKNVEMPEKSVSNLSTVFLSPGFFFLVLVFILIVVFS